jgi:hypothetical protein
VTHVRIVDVVGDGSARDSDGRVIWDPYPTILTAGFDLDAVGVIHEGAATVELDLQHIGFDYPGPEDGAGPHAPGSVVHWSVVSPWPSESGDGGRRWIASPESGSVNLHGNRTVDVQWTQQVWIEIDGQAGFGSVGTGWYDVGAQVEWSVQSPVPVADRVRLRAETTAGSFAALEPATVETTWIRESFLEVHRTRAGLVSPSSGWYSGQVPLTAQDRTVGERPVYTFREWQGDVPDAGGVSGDHEIILDLTQPRRVTAVFEFNDSLPLTNVTVSLRQGWNLISVPVFGENTALASLAARSGVLLPAWAWNSAGNAYEPLLHVLPGQGGWLFSAGEGDQLVIDGYHPGDSSPALAGGWQLFGISRADGNAVSPEHGTVWEWNAARQVYQPAETLREGRGYWRYSGQ